MTSDKFFITLGTIFTYCYNVDNNNVAYLMQVFIPSFNKYLLFLYVPHTALAYKVKHSFDPCPYVVYIVLE